MVSVGGPSAGGNPAPKHTDIPLPLTTFIGREREIVEVRNLLQTVRLLTLTGTGGCGKSRMALHLVGTLHETFPDGIRFVELASLTDPDLLTQTVASAIGVRDEPGQSSLDTLTLHFGFRRVLLILDNCEHLLLACAQLAEALLGACPNMQILATSREALGIAGETRWRVPSLRTPPPESWGGKTESVEAYEAVRLFVDRARSVRPDFTLTLANAAAIAQICWRLDGIPLAIELAAARVRVLSVEQVARHLDNRFRILTDGSRTALPRHQTLQATIDWSHDMLSPAERTVFRRLAVFAGGCSLEAAEGIASGEGIERDTVLGILTQLVDKSLVVVDEVAGEARYRLLETIRQYALDRLDETTETEQTRLQHQDWFVALAKQAKSGLVGPEQLEWLQRLNLEHDNLRAALTHCLSSNAEAGLEMAGSLTRFWRYRGHIQEGKHFLEMVLARTTSRTADRGWALNGYGLMLAEQGDFEKEAIVLQEAQALFREIDDLPGLIQMLRELVGTRLILGDRAADLRPAIEESLALARAIGDRRGEAFALVFLGRLLAAEGDFRGAMTLASSGLAILEETGDSWGAGQVRGDSGWLCLATGNYQQALLDFSEMRRLALSAGDWRVSGFALIGLSMAAQAVAATEDARDHLRAALQVFRSSSDAGLHETIMQAGYLAVQRGHYELGLRLLAAGRKGRSRASSWHFRMYNDIVERYWEGGISTATQALGPAASQIGYDAGCLLSREEAIAAAELAIAAAPTRADLPRGADTQLGGSPLSPREGEVVVLVARGLTNRQIAGELVISQATVERHISNVLNKLGLSSRSQIAVWAVQHGLLADAPQKT